MKNINTKKSKELFERAVKSIPGGVSSSSRSCLEGYNPYIENPYDPLGRVHAYPRPWLWLGGTGITLAHSDIAGRVVGAIFIVLSVFILKPSSCKEFFISALLLLSPAILLGVERGNNDLIVFIMLGVAGFMMDRNLRSLNYTAYLCLFITSFLKIYPVASFALLPKIIQDIKKFWAFILFSGLVFSA